MADRFQLLKESFRNLRNTGSVARSSRYLCQAIAEKIDPSKAKVVVELGPGDGVITQYLLDRLSPDAKLMVFEINDVFIDHLKTAFAHEPRLILIPDSATEMGTYFEQYGITTVDYFVSGIPFVMLPEALTIDIASKCRNWLPKKGLFIQFHYSPLLIPLYRRVFGNTDTDFIPLNLPPALVITCEKE